MSYVSPRVHNGDIYHHTQMNVVNLFKKAHYHLTKTMVHVSKDDVVTIELNAFKAGEFGGGPGDTFETIVARIYEQVEAQTRNVVLEPLPLPSIKKTTLAMAFRIYYRHESKERGVLKERFAKHPDSIATRAKWAARAAAGAEYKTWITVGDYVEHHDVLKEHGVFVQLPDLFSHYVIGWRDVDECRHPTKRLICSWDGVTPAFDTLKGNHIRTIDLNVYDRLCIVDPLTLPTYQFPLRISHSFLYDDDFRIKIIKPSDRSHFMTNGMTVNAVVNHVTRMYEITTSWYSESNASLEDLAELNFIGQFAMEIAEALKAQVAGLVVHDEPS